MCGIVGMVGHTANLPQVLAMCSSMKHRGPDYTGNFEDKGSCVLGHNRLSIIDLSSDANQPFMSEDGRYALVFNGEIYNYLELKARLGSYSFRTKSDTEVLLAVIQTWGWDGLNELNGMFAFGLWDNLEKKLHLVRDRFGVKPIYYAFYQNSLVFSSEIGPLFQMGVPKIPDESVWAGYFTNGSYGSGQNTFWHGIHRLTPGGRLVYEVDGNPSIDTWYDFRSGVLKAQQEILSYDPKEYIKQLLLDSINIRFRADVPVAFTLSGGLDSSMLFALIKNQFPDSNQIEAFTFYTGNGHYDEISYVEKLLKNTPYVLNPVLIEAKEVPALAHLYSNNQKEPFGGLPTLAYGKIFQVARDKGFKVLIDGQGADESWAGYDYYFSRKEFNLQGVSQSPYRKNVLNPDFVSCAAQVSYPEPFGDELRNTQYRDLFETKMQRALRFSDRISMLSSTELREPFVDYRLIEAIVGLPENMKMRNGVQKWLFREIASEFLDSELRLAPKRPVQTPQREWFANELKDWVMDEVSLLKTVGWFDFPEVEKELDLYFNGNQDSSFHLWQWINTAIILNQ